MQRITVSKTQRTDRSRQHLVARQIQLGHQPLGKKIGEMRGGCVVKDVVLEHQAHRTHAPLRT